MYICMAMMNVSQKEFVVVEKKFQSMKTNVMNGRHDGNGGDVCDVRGEKSKELMRSKRTGWRS